ADAPVARAAPEGRNCPINLRVERRIDVDGRDVHCPGPSGAPSTSCLRNTRPTAHSRSAQEASGLQRGIGGNYFPCPGVVEARCLHAGASPSSGVATDSGDTGRLPSMDPMARLVL